MEFVLNKWLDWATPVILFLSDEELGYIIL